MGASLNERIRTLKKLCTDRYTYSRAVGALLTQITMKLNFFNFLLRLLFCQREALANTAAAADRQREASVANALDPNDAIDFSETADGWFKISPYGTFRGKTPGRPQHVSPDNAKLMEGAFNSLLGKLGRKFRGVPIYHGHPDVDPEVWTDDRRIGKLSQLQARADGLWGYAEWNSLGEQNKAEGWWIYPSPRWDSPPGQTRFEPDRLISVGLTNTPRIAESEPVFNSLTPTDTTTMDPKLIRQKLGLAPEATDDECHAKIDALTDATTKGASSASELENAKTKLSGAEGKLTIANDENTDMANSILAKDAEIVTLREAHHNALLDAAQRETRITPAERPEWLTKLASEAREAAINALADLPKKLNSSALDLSASRGARQQFDDLREQVANAVAKVQKDEGLGYDAAWKKVKREPAFKAYFEGKLKEES